MIGPWEKKGLNCSTGQLKLLFLGEKKGFNCSPKQFKLFLHRDMIVPCGKKNNFLRDNALSLWKGTSSPRKHMFRNFLQS
jgi:hypothetical protein